MKILFLSHHISDDNFDEFKRNRTGFGYMIKDIITAISKTDNIITYTYAFTRGHNFGNIHYIKNNFLKVFVNLNITAVISGVRGFIRTKGKLKSKIQTLYYFLSSGYVESIITKENPDVVHIHGIGKQSIPFIQACIRCRARYVVTLHGLISVEDSVVASSQDKFIERKFLKFAYENQIPITVISSGIKRRIEKILCVENCCNVNVVKNATNIRITNNGSELKSIYGLANDAKIFISIGNITQNKNQVQIVRAFNLLPDKTKNKSALFIIGNDTLFGEVQREIVKLGLGKKVFCCGFVPKSEMYKYFEIADINVLASKYDGFGISIIESLVYGIPSVTFNDLDAVEDFYSEDSIILVNQRSDQALAEGMNDAVNKKWDKNKIKNLSSEFDFEQLNYNYKLVYKKAEIPTYKIIDFLAGSYKEVL